MIDVINRNNVKVIGTGKKVMVFAHGFGCDQNMWRLVTPAFENDYRIVLFDHVGSGQSDLDSYTAKKYGNLEGYADDIIEIIEDLNLKHVIFVGHSVAAMMGILAAGKKPELFSHLILVGPSPYYINEDDYNGGFTRPQINELLESMDNNHLGWSMAMAPIIMANADKKELTEELANSFCRTNPEIAKQFARTTFLSDTRGMLSSVNVPSLILQCSEDVIAPTNVGQYVHRHLPNSKILFMKATGHCPNLSAPGETIDSIKSYLSEWNLAQQN
jgi:sigma-B regulation protein RsbQ